MEGRWQSTYRAPTEWRQLVCARPAPVSKGYLLRLTKNRGRSTDIECLQTKVVKETSWFKLTAINQRSAGHRRHATQAKAPTPGLQSTMSTATSAFPRRCCVVALWFLCCYRRGSNHLAPRPSRVLTCAELGKCAVKALPLV